MMMCQYRFICCYKPTSLVGDIDNGGGYAYVGAGDYWEISVSSSLFFCASEGAQKKKKKEVFKHIHAYNVNKI